MSEISTQRRFEILAALKGTRCAGCGEAKKVMRSHCGKCYYALPPPMRTALYKRFGGGYEEAFEGSLQYLEERKAS